MKTYKNKSKKIPYLKYKIFDLKRENKELRGKVHDLREVKKAIDEEIEDDARTFRRFARQDIMLGSKDDY